jgi:hypothetical protein
MSETSNRVKIWRERTKKRIVEAFGGKCGICGYNKCQDAMDLHHIIPEEKDFSFGQVRANPKNWFILVKELRKCCLLCANCHREVHQGMTLIPENISKFNEAFTDYRQIEKINKSESLTDKCPICLNDKPYWNRSCSRECANKLKGKYDWEKFNLKELLFDQKKSISEIADLVGCSTAGVRKRLIKENLQKPSVM